MNDEKDKNNKSEQAAERPRELIISEISDSSDITDVNGSWIDERAEYYADLLRKQYASAKDQYPGLHPAAVKDLAKKFRTWPEEIIAIKNELFDLWEKAVIAKEEKGDVPESMLKEMNELAMKLNNYFANIERLGIPGLGVTTAPPESFEESNLRFLEAGLISGREELNRCRESFDMIESSIYKNLYDEKFLRQLTDFAKRIGIVEGWLNQLEQAKDSIERRLQKEKLSDEQIQEIFDNLAAAKENVKKNLDALGRGFERVRQDIEKGKEERNKLVGRLESLIDRIEDRAKIGFFASKEAEKNAKFMIERLSQMKSKPLDIQMVKSAEKEADEIIFAPEVKSDEKKEKMDMQYLWKRRVLDEQKRLDAMTDEIEAVSDRTKTGSKRVEDMLMQVGRDLDTARRRSDLLLEALDSINTPREMPLADIRHQLDSYKEEYLEAEKSYRDFSSEIAQAVLTDLRPTIMSALLEANKNFLTPEQRAMLEGWQIVFTKGGKLSLEEMNDFSKKLELITAHIDEKRKEYSVELKRKLDEQVAEHKFMAQGEKMEKPGSKFVPPESAKRSIAAPPRTEEEFFGGKKAVPAEKAAIGKADIIRGVKEMFEEQGIINLEPEKILSVLPPAEINSLIENIKEDVMSKHDSNRDAFERSLRNALNEKLLKALDVDKKERLCQAVSAQVYSLLKGAVEAEAQKEITKLQSGAADKLSKYGKIGASLVANIGFAAGVGVGAGLVIGSGGAAAAVAGASIGLARIANKAIAKSEIFQTAKKNAVSLWDKTVGKLFKKEISSVDADKVVEDAAGKFISPEIIAAILSNQLRENSSRELLRAVNAYSHAKSEVMRRPTLAVAEKFESALDETSREFYKKSYNYLAMHYRDQKLSEETLSKMALQMTLELSVYQRSEVRLLETLDADSVKSKMPDEKYWIVDKMEKIMKFRSEGVGAVVFGGAIAYAVSETTSAGRVVSGALAGAGLGLMLEKRTRKSETEKLFKVIEDIIDQTEKKLFARDAIILPSELVKAKKDAAYIRAQINAGAFEKNELLKNRAENFVVRVNQEMIKRYESPSFKIDDLLRDVNKHSEQLEKEMGKTVKKTLDIYKTKNRALAFMTVGAVVGGTAGYLGARLTDYIKGPKPEEIKLTETTVEPSPRANYEYSPSEKITPIETPAEPIGHVKAPRGGAHEAAERAAEKAPSVVSQAHEEAVTKAGEPIEVAEVYRASIYEWPKKEPLFFTRDEEMKINELTAKGDMEELSKFITQAKSRGQIYEDLKTGRQYHASELDFEKPKLYTTEEVYGKEPAPAAEALTQPVKKPIPENPYEELAPTAQKEIPASKSEVGGQKAEVGVSSAETDEGSRLKVEQITREAEARLVSELKSAKAREAYDWLVRNENSNRLTVGEKMAVKLLKDSFIEDMLDDNKISPKLLKQIEIWQNRIKFEL